MKIAFDAQLLMEAEKTGIGYVADGLCRAMKKQNKKDVLQMNFCRLREIAVPASLQEYYKLGFKMRCARGSYTAYKMAWNFIPWPYSRFFGKDADITMFFNYYIPPGVAGKKVTMFHDMAYRVFPETVRQRTKMMLDMNMANACKRADAIICVSEFTKAETLKYMDVDPDKLCVMPEGIRSERFHTDYPAEQISDMRTRYNIPKDYLLYLGTLEPRKNIVRMIEAYAMVRAKDGDVPPLVLAGRKGWMYDDIFRRITELGLEKNILTTGYLPDQDVPLLLAGAQAFFFPSIYEGFGLPPLEAMACGTPVLTSDGNSLKEVAGDCAVLVDPFDTESIADGMSRIIGDEALRQDLSRRGIAHAAEYTWERSAEVVYRLIDRLMLTR